MGTMRVRAAVLTLLVGACGFDPAGQATDADVADAAVEVPDATRTDAAIAVPFCSTDPDLVACYRFEGLPPVDESIYGNDPLASEVRLIPGVDGSALAFDDNSNALVPDSVSLDLTQITMELWLFVDTLPENNGNARAGIIDNNGQYSLYLTPTGTVRCQLASSENTGLQVTVGMWTHIACTYDGATIRLYQDGIAGPGVNNTNPMLTNGTDGMGLGQNSPSGEHLHGAVDSLRIWRVPRTPVQICEAAGC